MAKKSTISITIDPELVNWIDQMIQEKKFANRSHAIEYAVYQIKSKS
jgi:Arc/MetJ-type ribon-helix-helix transcriptional regulator